MARLPRLVVPFQAHHVIQRGNNRQVIFRDDDDHRFFLATLHDAAILFKVAIHAYVLMPNHLHLLVSPFDMGGLGRMMQSVGRYYVPYFNSKYGRVGTLWQGRFKASIIDSENYLMTCYRYIELNPVRGGMVAHPLEFAWSSYAHHVGLRLDPIIVDHPLYWALGNTPFEREVAYKELLEQGLANEDLEQVNQAVLKGWALGSKDFQRVLEAQINRRVGQAKRGRPSKNTQIIES